MNEVEVTVQAASEFLGVTERSVINYIRAREIEAIKVGKTWFISKPSLDGFSQRYGIRAGPTRHTGKDGQGEIEAPETANEYGEKLDGAVTSHSVSNLRLFVIATGILRDLTTQNLEGEVSFKEKIEQLRLEALENLGAGYYSYNPINKAVLYSRSRERVGGILALLYFASKDQARHQPLIEKIEAVLMPAYSALIRRMEKKRERT